MLVAITSRDKGSIVNWRGESKTRGSRLVELVQGTQRLEVWIYLTLLVSRQLHNSTQKKLAISSISSEVVTLI